MISRIKWRELKTQTWNGQNSTLRKLYQLLCARILAVNHFTCRSHMVQIIYFVKFQQSKPPNLVHIVLDQVRGVEFHVPVGSALAKHFVMIVVLGLDIVKRRVRLAPA